MFHQLVLELESIRQVDVWSYDIIKPKYLTYFEAKQFEINSATTRAVRIYNMGPRQGWLSMLESICQTDGPKAAVNLLIDEDETVSQDADVLIAIGRYLGMVEDFQMQKSTSGKLSTWIKKYRKEFLEDSLFDGLWEGFA